MDILKKYIYFYVSTLAAKTSAVLNDEIRKNNSSISTAENINRRKYQLKNFFCKIWIARTRVNRIANSNST